MNYLQHLFINLKYDSKNDDFADFYLALAKEITILKANYQLAIKTIYIATDDFLLLNNQQLNLVLKLIEPLVTAELIEYSFEIGYQTLKKEQLVFLKAFNVNRLVWKVRTFKNILLESLNKDFNAQAMVKLIKDSQKLSYENFSIDLEDNIAEQSETDIINDLTIALSFNAPHISYQSHTDQHNSQNRAIIKQYLAQHNYDNYEFFSFANKKANYSQQTLAYLTLKNWYGLGPNATSFLSLNKQNIVITNSNTIPWNSETTSLTTEEYYHLLITQSLMLRTGINLTEEHFLTKQKFWPQIINLINKGYLQIENDYLKATNQGWVLLNQILVDIIDST